MSTKTGSNPTCSVGLSVVGKPAIGTRTFVPFGRLCPRFDVSEAIINRFELEPELVIMPYFLPNSLGNFRSNLAQSSPMTSQPSSSVRTATIISCSSKNGPA